MIRHPGAFLVFVFLTLAANTAAIFLSGFWLALALALCLSGMYSTGMWVQEREILTKAQ